MKDARTLFEKYKSGDISPEENDMLQKWFHHLSEDEKSQLTPEDLILARRELHKNLSKLTGTRPVFPLWTKITSAAVILITVASAAYFYLGSSAVEQVQEDTIVYNDIIPGGNIATLTLGNGRKINLTDAQIGVLAEQSGIVITKAADGRLIYTVSDSDSEHSITNFNTIETPAGGQYQVNLPDGSKVWLNSSSSLRYPVKFSGQVRKVEVTGEAYFEVAHDKDMPFQVLNGDETVDVLGTHFNIMAYPDEKTNKTTLLEGSVRIRKNNNSKLLAPGEQARVSGANIDIVPVDTEAAIAWKNGYFIFKDEDLKSIMRQISRWYDVEIIYEGDISGKTFGGRIARSRNVSSVLEILESTGSLHFKIMAGNSVGKERRIIVMP